MPIRLQCPSCQSKLAIPDQYAGRRGKCPKCSTPIDVPAEAPESKPDERFGFGDLDPARPFDDAELKPDAPPAAADGEDRRPCPACGEMIVAGAVKCRYCHEVFDSRLKGALGGDAAARDPAWGKVRDGLNMMYKAILTMVIAVIVVVVGAVVGAAGAGPVAAAIGIAGGLVIMGAAITLIMGQVKCIAVPQSSGAKGFATGSVICIAVNIIVGIAGGVAQSPAISGLGNLIGLVGTILFILFIKRVATLLGGDETSASAGRFLIFTIVFTVLSFAGGIVLAAAPDVAMIVGIGLIICALISLVWYTNLLKQLIEVIDRRRG